MKFKFVVHDPNIWGPIFSEVELDVDDSSTVESIKRKIIPELTKEDTYSTYFKGKQITIECQPPTPESASLVTAAKPPVVERLAEEFGRREPPKYSECYEIPYPYLLGPASTFGEESEVQKVAEIFVSMIRHAKLDDKLCLREQGVKESSRIFLSIDIDFAIKCSSCKKQMHLGHVYNAMGTDLAGVYTQLDAFCDHCNWKRKIALLPPVVVRVHDKIRRRLLVSYDKGVQVTVQAHNGLWKEYLARERQKLKRW